MVAHLWAADRLGQAYPFAPDPLSLESWPVFLEAAQGIFEFGKTYIPKRSRSKKSILDGDDYWVLPKVIQAIHLQTHRKPDALLKLLKNYKAPKTRV